MKVDSRLIRHAIAHWTRCEAHWADAATVAVMALLKTWNKEGVTDERAS